MYQDFPDGFVDLHDGVAVLDDELIFVLTWLVGQNFLVDTKRLIIIVFGVKNTATILVCFKKMRFECVSAENDCQA